MQTRTPLPVAPSSAHSRVTRSGHCEIEPDLVRRPRRERPCGKRALLCYARFWASLSRCAITWSIFHAIDAFDSTSGRKSQDVMP